MKPTSGLRAFENKLANYLHAVLLLKVFDGI